MAAYCRKTQNSYNARNGTLSCPPLQFQARDRRPVTACTTQAPYMCCLPGWNVPAPEVSSSRAGSILAVVILQNCPPHSQIFSLASSLRPCLLRYFACIALLGIEKCLPGKCEYSRALLPTSPDFGSNCSGDGSTLPS